MYFAPYYDDGDIVSAMRIDSTEVEDSVKNGLLKLNAIAYTSAAMKGKNIQRMGIQ